MAARMRRRKVIETWSGQIVMPDVSTERLKDTKESDVLSSIRAVLEKMPDVHVMRNSSGRIRVRNFWMPIGLGKGSADLVAIVAPHGRWLCLETKRPRGGRVDPDQERWLANMRALGAVCGVVRSTEEALALVAEARRAA